MPPVHSTTALLGSARHQWGLVTAGQLHDSAHRPCDVRRLVQTGVLVPVRRGVYVDGEVWRGTDPWRGQPVLRMRAATLTIRSTGYVFSHDSAALLLGMGAPDPTRCLVHVTRPKVHGDAQRGGVKHHRAPYLPEDVVEVEGLRVLGPARTALDMTREHGRADGLAACDAAMRLGVGRAALAEQLERMWCWPRSLTMRWCVEMADPGAESYLESLARDLVLELVIGFPHTQFGLRAEGRTVWCDIRVGRHLFEADGELKYDEGNPSGLPGRIVLAEEKARQDFVTGFKLGVSRITHTDIGAGRARARTRLLREYTDTCRRFGTDVTDLAPYVVTDR